MQQHPIDFKLADGRSVEIRSPQPDEASLTLAGIIEIAVKSPYILSTVEDFKKRTLESQIKWIEESTQNKSAIILAAFFAGRIVGLCDARSFKDVKRKHRAALGVSIHEDFRSCGLGRKLTETLLDNIKKFEGIKIIELDVMSANSAAIKLYESLGFKRAGVLPRAYVQESGEELDNISMYIQL